MTQTYHHVGIIGFGARGQQLAEMIYQQNPEYACVAAAADINEYLTLPTSVPLNCREFKLYRDYHDLLSDSRIDSVIVTTYPENHAQIVMDAIGAGKAVLCDKPVTGSREDAVKLYRFLRSTPSFFRIGLNLPFYPVTREIKRQLEAGRIGKLLCVRGMCDVGAHFGRTVILRKFAGQKEGLLLGKLTHDCDLMQFLAGSYAEEVYARTENFLWKRHGDNLGSDDTAIISGILHNGVLFSQSLTSCGATYGRRMEFWGEKGCMHADINSETLTIEPATGKKEVVELTPSPGSHRGADKIMFASFLDYVDSGLKNADEPERVLTSILIPTAAMENTLVHTGKWYRSIITAVL